MEPEILPPQPEAPYVEKDAASAPAPETVAPSLGGAGLLLDELDLQRSQGCAPAVGADLVLL